MTSGDFDRDVDAAAERLYDSVPGGDGLLRRVAESVRSVTGGAYVCVLQRRDGGDEGVVMALAGRGGPQLATSVVIPSSAPPRRLVIPLSLDGATIGAVVADGIPSALPTEAHRELTLLAGLTARALQRHALMAEAERRVVQKLQHQFRLLSGTVGQLRDAVSAATGVLEILEQEAALVPSHQEQVMRARRALGQALRLLSELHELGRAESGELVAERTPVDLATLLRELVHGYQIATRPSGVEIHVELAALPLLRTDGDCVRRVLDNLLSNAVRYSPPGAPITVRALVRSGRRVQDPASWVRVDVVDRGPGVAEGDAVFEEIARTDEAGRPGFRLAVSRRMARLLGGNLTLQTAPGGGSTFTLWLPLE